MGAWQEQDQERAARSLNQAGMSTSAQLLLNARSDLGGDDSNALHAQCLVRPETGQASLHKVGMMPQGNKPSRLGLTSHAYCDSREQTKNELEELGIVALGGTVSIDLVFKKTAFVICAVSWINDLIGHHLRLCNHDVATRHLSANHTALMERPVYNCQFKVCRPTGNDHSGSCGLTSQPDTELLLCQDMPYMVLWGCNISGGFLYVAVVCEALLKPTCAGSLAM